MSTHSICFPDESNMWIHLPIWSYSIRIHSNYRKYKSQHVSGIKYNTEFEAFGNPIKTALWAGIKLQGDWGEIVALEGSKSPWEAQRATKTSPSVFATFEKASTYSKRTSCWRKSSEK